MESVRYIRIWSYCMSVIRLRACSLVVLALTLAVLGCAATSAATAPTSSPGGAQNANGCAAARVFVGAKPATAGARFADVVFPAGALGYSSTDPEANGFQF